MIRFRPLTDDDLPMMHAWLNEPGVVEWWEGDDVSWPAVVADYGSSSSDPTDHYLALDDGGPFGWIQAYAVADFADEAETQAWFALGYPRTGAGIDYLIGEPGRRGQGRGSAMIRTFIDQIVWPQHPGWTHVGASPQRANGASCGALARAGLTLMGSFDDSEFGPCDLYVEKRPSHRRVAAVVQAGCVTTIG